MDESRQKLFQRTRVVGLLTLCSRVLGLIRDATMARQFGNGVIMDAFTVAFRAPNLARQLFGEGALSTAFLPIFLRDIEQHGRATAFRTASAVIAAAGVALLGLVAVTEAVLLGLRVVLDVGAEGELLLGLLASLIPYLLMVCLLAQTCAVMQGLGQFTAPAWFPVLLNILWIGSIWLAGEVFETDEARIYAISWSIVLIGAVQFGLSIPTLRQIGFRFEWDWPSGRQRVREIAIVIVPVLLGLSVTQLNTLCDSLLAWALTAPAAGVNTGWLAEYPLREGTAAALYLGQRMYQFPLGVFGAALGTVIFPLLATHAERQQFELFRDDLTRGLKMVLAIGVPASAGLAVIAPQLTSVLFLRGEFDQHDAAQTSGIIVMYALGVWAACGLLIVNRAFYALGDRRSPLRIGLLAVGVNLVLNLSFVWSLGGAGLALASGLTANLQSLASAWLMTRRVNDFRWRPLMVTFLKTVIATAAMIVSCLYIQVALKGAAGSAFGLFAIVSVGAATFLAAASLLGLREPIELLSRRRRHNHNQSPGSPPAGEASSADSAGVNDSATHDAK
ncbi:murein biosynthesis integral membrane protein MurJ [bacterium]|nr:murein biosynthesis integral membrane protein MurJ [bacterium]